MQEVIYLDVLIIINIYVSYFLFLGSARLMSLNMRKLRLFLGSMTGGIFSLIILFDLSGFELVAIKLLMGVTLILIVFATKSVIHTLKCGLYFFLVNFIFAGFMFALWTFIAPANMAYKNGVVYFDITALTLVISTILAYLAITLFSMILNKRSAATDMVSVTISLGGRETVINAFADTGNKLCDIFSGLPVIVVEYDFIADIFPEKIKGYFKNPTAFSFDGLDESAYISKLKLIPVSVVSKETVLPAFRPDYVVINSVKKTAVIAVSELPISNGSFNAILNTALL